MRSWTPTDTRLIAFLVVGMVCAFAWWTGVRAIDFGHHWDEHRVIHSVARSMATGVLLPGWYNYPSLSYDLALTGLLPELPSILGRASPPSSTVDIFQALGESVLTSAFHLRVRAIFLGVTLLAGFAVYLLTVATTNRPWLGALAAALLVLSWEVGYHARWIAPDGPMMTFMTFTALGAVMSLKSAHPRRWLMFTAVMTAITLNAKYNGGVAMLVAVLLVARCSSTSTDVSGQPLKHQLIGFARLSGPLLVAVVSTSLVLTPGALIAPGRFITDVRYEMLHYAQVGHGGYDTRGFVDHLVLVLQYLTFHGLSARTWMACLLAGVALTGAIVVARRRDFSALVVLGLPLVYVLLMSSQRVLIVRNMLCIIPFLAFLAAVGLGAVHDALTKRWRRLYVVPLVAAWALLLNASWLYRASETVVARSQRAPAQEMHAYLAGRPARDRFLFSRKATLKASLQERDSTPVTRQPDLDAVTRSTWVVFLSTDLDTTEWWRWPANRVAYRLLPSGPYEVNWTYYPTWTGDERFVMLPLSDVINSPLRVLLQDVMYEIQVHGRSS